MSCNIIGIDLGTTYSCVGVYREDVVEIIADHASSERVIPSHVAFNTQQQLFGVDAKLQVSLNPKNSVFDIKRLIGRDFDDPIVQADKKLWSFDLIEGADRKPTVVVELRGQEKKFIPEQISGLILRNLKEMAEAYLGETVTEAVITVPAYFNNLQKQATKDAAKLAGLEVRKLINEPTAAALAYGLETRYMPDRNVLVYDLGGGTFDVSVMRISRGNFKVKATNGDTHLGGEDFDNLLVEHFIGVIKDKLSEDITNDIRAVRRLRSSCEKAKRLLSKHAEANVEVLNIFDEVDFNGTISRAKFENMCDHLFQKTIDCVKDALSDACLSTDEVDEIVVVGGSTRIPKIRTLLSDFFGGKQLHDQLNPDEAIAYGAAIQGAILAGVKNEKLQDVGLHDIAPLSIGKSDAHGVMHVFIERNTEIPVKVVQSNWTTHHDNQTTAVIRIFEGERKIAEDNEFLGKFILEGIPALPKGEAKLEHTFEIDADGLLHVTSVCKNTGSQNNKTIKERKGYLNEEIIDLLCLDAKKYAEQDKLAVKQANDNVLRQLNAERRHEEQEYNLNLEVLMKRQQQYFEQMSRKDDEIKKGQEILTSMESRHSEITKQLIEKNEQEKKQLLRKIEDTERRYKQVKDHFELAQKEHEKKIEIQKKELQQEFKAEQLREREKNQEQIAQISTENNAKIGELKQKMFYQEQQNQEQQEKFNRKLQQEQSNNRRNKEQFQEHQNKLVEVINKDRNDIKKHQENMKQQLKNERQENRRRENELKLKMAEEQEKLKARFEKTREKMKQDFVNERQESRRRDKELKQKFERDKKELDMKFQEEQKNNQERERKLLEAINEEKLKNKEREAMMMRYIEKKQYETEHPKPEHVSKHESRYPKSFRIQILGTRGAGKSTLVNEIVRRKVAQTGNMETTTKTSYHDITHLINNKPTRYKSVFIVDQPGIGGLKITERQYLTNFGPGHFNMTYLLCKDGFNELDLSLLRTLLIKHSILI